ncbi:general secretion pathway protein H [Neorhizobium sp. 2083]|uniref:prepilin-type N-terminal cleavage/methylation domain-containing protein n=1 Tax=Neorhizobium sp. 2083 TaxID=2817762 RepID=UPI00285C134F|nr:prepilin-type N-terminal cleavage/methylation domain-containing protein [Neorhizobium sp. 2083]MDR6821131.1 general secretion pathway protein H [Neorhizobium sp. 2083]
MDPSSTRRDKIAGFSLTEMLVVLAIIGILFSLAIPSYRSLTRVTPQSVARQVLYMAQSTRLSALKTGSSKSLFLDTRSGSIRSDAKVATIVMPAAIAFSATIGRDNRTTAEQGNITFFPNGSATGGAIRFRSGGAPEAVLLVNWLTGVPTLTTAASHEGR